MLESVIAKFEVAYIPEVRDTGLPDPTSRAAPERELEE